MKTKLFYLASLVLFTACSGGGSDVSPPTSRGIAGPSPTPQASLIWLSSSGLFRSQTDGTGLITLDSNPAMPLPYVASGALIVYNKGFHLPAGPPRRDVWVVHINGTGQRVLANNQDDEILRDTIGPWAIYDRTPEELRPNNLWSSSLDGQQTRLLVEANETAGEQTFPFYHGKAAGRAIYFLGCLLGKVDPACGQLHSILPNGTERRQLTSDSFNPRLVGTVGTRMIYSQLSENAMVPDILSVPVTGGPSTTLADSQDYEWVGLIVGSSVVYHRCEVHPPSPVVGQCDVYSVNGDGSGTIALSTHPDNERVQGLIGSRVIVRRNSGATDSLYSIPAGGGTETHILTLEAQAEFVIGIVDDRIILLRPSGVWSVQSDGSNLIQLTNQRDEFAGSAGSFACLGRGDALWCVPVDGSAEARQVTDEGTFVAGL